MTDPRFHTVAAGVARVSWDPDVADSGLAGAVTAIEQVIEAAFVDHHRVEVLVATDDVLGHRIATWSGMRREGVRRGSEADDGSEPRDRYVFARLATDEPASDPEGFRMLLNSFLPRKRAIAQMLIRDPDDRVLFCHLTYKRDWDLPGGVVEVGESPRLAVAREVEEELGLGIEAGQLLLTDWMPPWSGWDDAVCLVFDGGVHDPRIARSIVREEREIKGAKFLTLDEATRSAADFTVRRLRAALDAAQSGVASYTESGHPL